MRRCVGVTAIVALVAAATGLSLALARGDRAGALRLVRVASGFERPVFVTAPRTEHGRLYVVEQRGVVRVLIGGKLRGAPFLDIRSLVDSDGNEQGLLGLAFDPAYAKNHRFYVDYTGKPNGDTYVVAYRSDGTRAIRSSARRLLHVPQPYANHNGGMVGFGPDGKLYVGMGDGGSGGDPENRAQNPDQLLGKLLRLDPSGKVAPAFRALGLRNPWRFSFDRKNGDIYIGDVGQNAIEEVDFILGGTTGLFNFGWRVYEGRSVFEQGALGPGLLTMPIAQYTHDDGCSVSGGYVYRGKAVPAAAGRYFYGDYCSGTIWSLTVKGQDVSQPRQESFQVKELSSFGEDAAGELYLISLDGTIFRLRG
jgi:glucose/arabinose dehydrogenase